MQISDIEYDPKISHTSHQNILEQRKPKMVECRLWK